MTTLTLCIKYPHTITLDKNCSGNVINVLPGFATFHMLNSNYCTLIDYLYLRFAFKRASSIGHENSTLYVRPAVI